MAAMKLNRGDQGRELRHVARLWSRLARLHSTGRRLAPLTLEESDALFKPFPQSLNGHAAGFRDRDGDNFRLGRRLHRRKPGDLASERLPRGLRLVSGVGSSQRLYRSGEGPQINRVRIQRRIGRLSDGASQLRLGVGDSP